jgi:hypothetical protein
VGESQSSNNTGGVRERVTIREAATLLGVHPNTVRNRVKAEVYSAQKVVTERGETWMIDRDSLTAHALSTDPQQPVGRVPALPQEALQKLAGGIVREVGIAQDPEHGARLEASKLRMEAAKTQLLLSSGSLVGMAAVAGVLPTTNRLQYLWLAVFTIGASAVFAFMHMADVAKAVAAQGPPADNLAQLGPGALAAGLLAFGCYICYNVPLRPGEWPYGWSRDQVVLYSVVAAVVGLAIILPTMRSLGRRRGSRMVEAGREPSA